MTVPFIIVWYSFYEDQLWVKFFMRGNWIVIGLYALLYFIIGRVYDAFKMSYHRKGEMIYSQLLSLLEVNVIIYIVAWLLIRHIPAILPALLVYGIQSVFSVLWSYLSQTWYFHTFPANRTVVIWGMRPEITHLIDQ